MLVQSVHFMPRRAGRKYQLRRLAREYASDVKTYRFSPYIGTRSAPRIIRQTACVANIRIVSGPAPAPAQQQHPRREARLPLREVNNANPLRPRYTLVPITLQPVIHQVDRIPEGDPRRELYARTRTADVNKAINPPSVNRASRQPR